jgi:hypothetical protein
VSPSTVWSRRWPARGRVVSCEAVPAADRPHAAPSRPELLGSVPVGGRRRGQVGRAVRRTVHCRSLSPLVSTRSGSSSGLVSSRPVSNHLAPSSRPTCPAVWCRPSGGQLSGVRPSVLWRPSRPGSPCRGPWGARRFGRAFTAGVGGVPCGLPGARASPSTLRGLDAGDAAAVVGRARGACRSRVADLDRVALGLRRRPRSAVDRPGRPAWPGSLAAGG